VICPGCQKDNEPKRRYCGRCGTNFQPVCRRCRFANAADDRFCGGCGAQMAGGEGWTDRVDAPAPMPVAALPSQPAPSPLGELNGLFASAPAPVTEVSLPDTGVSQDDLDRLFGVAL
jgi:hypothetical protein